MNVKDWARVIQHKLPNEQNGAFESFLCGNETFAEACVRLIEAMAEAQKEDEDTNRIERIKNRIANGEDAELVVREETKDG